MFLNKLHEQVSTRSKDTSTHSTQILVDSNHFSKHVHKQFKLLYNTLVKENQHYHTPYVNADFPKFRKNRGSPKLDKSAQLLSRTRAGPGRVSASTRCGPALRTSSSLCAQAFRIFFQLLLLVVCAFCLRAPDSLCICSYTSQLASAVRGAVLCVEIVF